MGGLHTVPRQGMTRYVSFGRDKVLQIVGRVCSLSHLEIPKLGKSGRIAPSIKITRYKQCSPCLTHLVFYHLACLEVQADLPHLLTICGTQMVAKPEHCLIPPPFVLHRGQTYSLTQRLNPPPLLASPDSVSVVLFQVIERPPPTTATDSPSEWLALNSLSSVGLPWCPPTFSDHPWYTSTWKEDRRYQQTAIRESCMCRCGRPATRQ